VPLISRAVLTARLRELEDHGIIERRARTDGSGHEYWLTPAGNAFRSVVGALGQWGLVHARDRIKPSDLDPSILMWGFFRKRADATRCRIGALSCASSSPMCRQRAPSSGSMWLILERTGVDVCAKDPGFAVDLVMRGRIADFVAVYLGHARWRDLAGKGADR